MLEKFVKAFIGVLFIFVGLGYIANKIQGVDVNTVKTKTVQPKVVKQKVNPIIEKEFNSKLNKALSEIKKERKVLKATSEVNFMNNKILVISVGVIDDKSRREGYAEYLCLVLNQYGVLDKKYDKNIIIRVNDAKAMMTMKKNIILGEKICK